MAWPVRTDEWRDGARPARRAVAVLARAIADFEPVTLCVPAGEYAAVRALFPLNGGVRVLEMSCFDAWMRDVGPTFLVDAATRPSRLGGVAWGFNNWGYGAAELTPGDAALMNSSTAVRVLDAAGAHGYIAPIVLEGGSVHTDGDGTLLVTEECLLNPNRNPGHDRAAIEAVLRDYLGVTKIIWLPLGVAADETSGHVDNLCCFVRPGVVALTWTDDRTDPQYERSSAAERVLLRTTDALGRALQVHRVHQPRPQHLTQAEYDSLPAQAAQLHEVHDRLPASYINYYLANGAVIVPQFGDAIFDERALATLRALHPERTVVPVATREVLLGGGNIHCLTQQQPAVARGWAPL